MAGTSTHPWGIQWFLSQIHYDIILIHIHMTYMTYHGITPFSPWLSDITLSICVSILFFLAWAQYSAVQAWRASANGESRISECWWCPGNLRQQRYSRRSITASPVMDSLCQQDTSRLWSPNARTTCSGVGRSTTIHILSTTRPGYMNRHQPFGVT